LIRHGKERLTHTILLVTTFVSYRNAYGRRNKTDKGKGKFVPAHAMRHMGGVEVEVYTFLSSAKDGFLWSTSISGGFLISGSFFPG
jgi:hypothetical protein